MASEASRMTPESSRTEFELSQMAFRSSRPASESSGFCVGFGDGEARWIGDGKVGFW